MRCSVVTFAGLMVVGVPSTQGQTFGHFDIGSRAPSAGTASPATIAQDMVSRVVREQLQLQAGPCASSWASGLSTQCPPESVMALKGYGGSFGLTSFFQCRPAGCLHAQDEEGTGGDASRDKRDILREAVAQEVSMLVKEQPGTSFEKHLAAMEKRYAKEGAIVEGILSALLPEALLGEHLVTTLTFFAELASYRGFAGAVVDNAWAYLHKSHREEMVLASCREAAKTQAETVTRQEGVISDLKAELATALERGHEMTEEADQLRSSLSAAHESERKSAKAAAEFFSGLSVAHDREQKAAGKKLAGLTSELANVQTLLAEERINATAAAQMAAKAAKKTNAEIRGEADASVQEAQNESAGLRASLSAAVEAQAVSAKKAEGVAFELASVQQLLAEERTAKAAMGMQVKAAEGATAEARSEVDACLQESHKQSEGLRASFSAMMKQQQEISAEKVAEAATQLADVRQLLAEERNATAAAAIMMETVHAHSEAVRVEARAALEKAADTEVALLANVSSSLEGQEAATSELAAVRAQLLAVEIKQRKIVFAMSESVDTCHHSLDAKAGTIEKLKRELKDERTGENAQRGWRLDRTKVMNDLDACTVRARERLVLFDEKIEELKGAADKMDAAMTVMVSLQKEVDTCGEKLDMCEEQLASLPSSNDQCNCAGTEVPATVGGGNDSVSGAPAP